MKFHKTLQESAVILKCDSDVIVGCNIKRGVVLRWLKLEVREVEALRLHHKIIAS